MARDIEVNGVTYDGAKEIDVTAVDGTARFYETSEDTATAADVKAGETYHGADGESVGTMADNGSYVGTIAEKDDVVTIPEGYHDGAGKVTLSAEAQEALAPENIMLGSNVLGVTGTGDISGRVADWLDENISNPSNPPIDKSLTVSGAAADAKVAGNKLDSIENRYISTENIFTDVGTVVGILNASGEVVGTSNFTTDFLPCTGDTTYYFSAMGGAEGHEKPGFFKKVARVVAFYDAANTFINRIVDATNGVITFTTPSSAAYVRVSSFYNTFYYQQIALTANGVYPYIVHYALNGVSTGNESQIDKIRHTIYGITDKDYQPYAIRNNVWVYGAFAWEHFMIPVNTGDTVSITSPATNGCIWALLTADRWTPDAQVDTYADRYEITMDDDGNVEYTPVVDGEGVPIKDGIHEMLTNRRNSFYVTPGASYLYVQAGHADSHNTMPQQILVNGVEFVKADNENTATIFFDDFDDFDESVWTRHTQEPPVDGGYASRFYTDESNAYAEQSCLVLTCKKSDGDNGTYLDSNGIQRPIAYHAPYVSTCDTYAIPHGRISARLRTLQAMGEGFPWAFWTFGQNAAWAYAHEMDIAEQTHFVQRTQTTSQNGTVIPDGSFRNIFASHVHARQSDGTQREAVNYMNMTANINGQKNVRLSNKLENIDPMEWHIYSVEWDESRVTFFVDDQFIRSNSATSLAATDAYGSSEVGFFYPQDIRFNIKAWKEYAEADSATLLVDWVRVEAIDCVPALSITHNDIVLSVGETAYINPTFNEGCTNCAFTAVVDDAAVISYSKYNNDASQMAVHKITALASGVATVRITAANGVVTSTFTVSVI